MPNETTNYKLKKPLTNEYYDVAVDNENMDKIDAQMKVNADTIEEHKNSATAHDASKLTYTGLASNNTPVTVKKALDDTDERIDGIVASVGNTNTEIVDARDNLTGATYPTLKDRLDTEYEEVTQQLADIAVNVKYPPVPLIGAKGDGISDDKAEINNILSTKTKVKFLNGVYSIDPVIGLTFKSKQEVEFDPFVTIQANATSATFYKMVLLDNLSDVIIKGNGAKILGERNTHIGTTGEWGMGISLSNSKNIYIENLYVADCWGDSVYLGASEFGYNENIHLKNVITDNSRRQGFSVVSAVGLVMDNCQALNIKGTAPEAGIDFEPNHPTQKLERITVNNFYSFNTQGNGILVYANNVPYIDITINSHKHVGDVNQGGAFQVNGGNVEQNGVIKNNNPIYKKTVFGPVTIRNRAARQARIEIHNPLIIDCNTIGNTSPIYSAAFSVFALSAETGTDQPIGNVHIYNPSVKGASKCVIVLYTNDLRGIGSEKISLINPISVDGCMKNDLYVTSSNFYLKDENEVLTYTHDLGIGVPNYSFRSKYVLAPSATGSRTSTLYNNIPAGVTLEFLNLHATYVYAINGIEILGLATNLQTVSLPYAASIRIKKINATQWTVVSRIGNIAVA